MFLAPLRLLARFKTIEEATKRRGACHRSDLCDRGELLANVRVHSEANGRVCVLKRRRQCTKVFCAADRDVGQAFADFAYGFTEQSGRVGMRRFIFAFSGQSYVWRVKNF